MTQPVQPPTPSAQPSTYDGSNLTIQPQDVSTQPSTPAAPQTPNQAAGNPPIPSNQPKQPSQGDAGTAGPAPASMHARLFDKILKGMTGGDLKVIAPDGSVKTIPQSRASMGKSIVAAALTGLMTPTQYTQTPYGPRVNYEGTAGAAAQAGTAVIDQKRQQAQTLTDQQQARKLQFTENNMRLMTERLAAAHAQHVNWQEQQADAKPFLDSLHTYDQERPNDPAVPKAILFEGLTHDQALAKAKEQGLGLTEANYIPDGGWRPTVGPNGEQEMEPTYAVLNPNLDRMTLTPDIAKKLSTVNSQYDAINDKVGGPVQIPQNMWVSAWHDYSALQRVNEAMSRLNRTVNGKDAKDIDLSDLVRGNRRLVPELSKVVSALATGNAGTGEGENPANVLDVLLKNSPEFLTKLGLTTEQAADKRDQFVADRAEKMARAKNAGTAKEEADPAYVEQLKAAVATLPADQQKDLMGTLNQDVVTKREAEKVMTAVKGYQTSNQSDQTRRLLAGGDPVEVAKFAHNVVRGDISQIDKLPSRGDARIKAMDQVHDEAVNLGLDSTKYTDSYLTTKADMQKDYASRNRKTTGAQIGSFDAFLGHGAGAADALDALKSKTFGLTRQPLVNVASDVIGKQLTNDVEWKRWETSLAPVRNEISNFLAAGYKPDSEEGALMNQILDKHETPARIMGAISQLADTADIRLAALGRGYTQTMDKNYPELLSPDAANTLKRLHRGEKDYQPKSAAFSGKLQQGWDAQGNLQQLTSKDLALAQRFVKAAGGDRNRAVELARANGWILQ